ncbi:hypothetical protein ACJMK2_015456 [Sinanodonta woodiana]|uniref:Homeobox domain-containing protein n=1 Tax=Sinanodonta woodiana TaxID=1069815 RepID=A0ABD3UTP2_SINWO
MKTTTTAAKDTQKRQRSRTKYTEDQLLFLERVFQQTQYPDSPMLEDLSVKLEIAAERLSIWFQNRRSKFKRQSKDGHVLWMRKQIFNREDQRGMVSPYMTETGAWDKNQRHVLSPPSTSSDQLLQDAPWGKPSSNLHYMPLMSTQLVQSPHQSLELQISNSPQTNSTPSPVSSDPSSNLMPSSNSSRSTTSPRDMDTFHCKKTHNLLLAQPNKDNVGCHDFHAGQDPLASPLMYPTYTGYTHSRPPPPYPSNVPTSLESKRSPPNDPGPKPFSLPPSSYGNMYNWMIEGSQQSPMTSSSRYKFGQSIFPESETMQNSPSQYPVDLVPNWMSGGGE